MGGKTTNEQHKSWRDRNREHLLAYKKAYRRRPEFKETVSALLQDKRDFIIASRSQPCMDCKLSYPHYVMEFDHTRGVKAHKVTAMSSRSIDAIITEMAKCDVVCANCHRIRTHERGQLKVGRRRANTL